MLEAAKAALEKAGFTIESLCNRIKTRSRKCKAQRAENVCYLPILRLHIRAKSVVRYY